MPRTVNRPVPALLLVAVVALLSVTPRLFGQSGSPAFPSTANGEWPHYNGDIKGSRYSPLDQINATNFNKLEVAWRFKTDNLGPRPEYKLEGTPLMVKGILYATGRHAPRGRGARREDRRAEVDLQPGRGRARGDGAPRQLSGRGLSYWTDGKGDERIVYVTIGYRLVSS